MYIQVKYLLLEKSCLFIVLTYFPPFISACLCFNLQTCEKSQRELQQLQANVGEGDVEIFDNIQFYTDNIRGLTDELSTLRGKEY